jgi:hypothetical protein
MDIDLCLRNVMMEIRRMEMDAVVNVRLRQIIIVLEDRIIICSCQIILAAIFPAKTAHCQDRIHARLAEWGFIRKEFYAPKYVAMEYTWDNYNVMMEILWMAMAVIIIVTLSPDLIARAETQHTKICAGTSSIFR